MKKAVVVTRLLNNKVNSKIIDLIKDKTLNVGEIAVELNKAHCDISKRLSNLNEVGIVEGKKEGKYVYYSQVKENVKKYVDLISKF